MFAGVTLLLFAALTPLFIVGMAVFSFRWAAWGFDRQLGSKPRTGRESGIKASDWTQRSKSFGWPLALQNIPWR